MLNFTDRIEMGCDINKIGGVPSQWGTYASSYSVEYMTKCHRLCDKLPFRMEVRKAEDGSIQFKSENKKVLIGIYEDRISLFYVDAFSDTHLMPNIPQDYLIDFLKEMCKDVRIYKP